MSKRKRFPFIGTSASSPFRIPRRPLRTCLLAVYGTLLSGEGRHGVLGGTRLVGAGKTPSEYTMYTAGDYPVLTNDGDTPIVVEVYEVPEQLLDFSLDYIELVHQGLYTRGNVVVNMDSGEQLSCVVYVATRETARKCHDYDLPIIKSGNWRYKDV